MASVLEANESIGHVGGNRKRPALPDDEDLLRAIHHPHRIAQRVTVDVRLEVTESQRGRVGKPVQDGGRIAPPRPPRDSCGARESGPGTTARPSIRRNRNTRCISENPEKPNTFANRMRVDGWTSVSRAVSATVCRANRFGSLRAYCAIRCRWGAQLLEPVLKRLPQPVEVLRRILARHALPRFAIVGRDPHAFTFSEVERKFNEWVVLWRLNENSLLTLPCEFVWNSNIRSNSTVN